MAIGWMYFRFLEQHGVFGGDQCSILDIGAQNIFDIPVAAGVEFLERYGHRLERGELQKHVEELSARAIWPPKKVGLFLHEFLEGTSIDYVGFDIFPGPNVQIFDLNYQSLAPGQKERFDVVLNFGTTEHVFNQFNCFKVIHEAAKPGAFMFHQLPCAGWMDHGYWIYSPRTFMDLAGANDYEVCEMWFSGPQGDFNLFERVTYAPRIRNTALPENLVELWEKTRIVNGLVNVLLRKRRSVPFKLGLDITTSAGGPDAAVFDTYYDVSDVKEGSARRTNVLRLFSARELASELSFRVRRRLGLTR